MLLGAHVKASGGVWKAVEHGTELGCEAIQIFAGQAQPFGALRSSRDKDCLKAEGAKVIERKIGLIADRHIAKIIQIGKIEHLTELLAQAALHGVFVRINAVLCQSTRFDIAIK